MTTLLGWLVRKIGVLTLFTLALLLIALGCVALGVRGIVRGLDVELVTVVTLAAILTGWLLAKSPFPGWLAGIVAIVLGVETIAFRVGQLGGKVGAVVRTLIELARGIIEWAWSGLRWQPRSVPDPTPLLRALTELWNAINALLVRLRDWLSAVTSGTPAFDPVAVAIVWCAILWVVAVWVAWGVRRREQPFMAMAPAIALLSATLAYTGANPFTLIPLLGATLLLMALVGHTARERWWASAGISAAEDLGLDLSLVVILLSLLLIAAAWVTPSISVREIVQTAQRLMREQIGEAGRLPDSFGLELQPAQPTIFDTLRAPGLPRHHLIGAGAELSRQVAMIVKTDDTRSLPEDVAPPRYYWRSTTYDRYTGRGWYSDKTQVVEYKAGDPVIGEPLPAYRRVRQNVQVVGDVGGLLYATGTLVTADHDFRVAWRSPGDAFSVDIGATTYRAESRVPAVGEEQLRSAGANYPDWVTARYLYLPDDVPPRVLALARDLTATQLTPYDRARTIEAYLRGFPYTLDLPAPPPNRDVVDYFLFDLKKGYCDYFATAMVVLTRAAGVPARLVVGYAPGTFDAANARYVVTEADAHAWAEVYFPGYGWVEFEPTSNRAPIEHSAQPTLEGTPESESTPGSKPIEREVERNWWLAVQGGFALLALGVVAAFVINDWRLRRLAPSATVAEIYRRLNRHAKRLGVPVRASDTPNEFATAFAARLALCHAEPFACHSERSEESRSWAQGKLCEASRSRPLRDSSSQKPLPSLRSGQALRMTSAADDVRALTALYVQACYGPREPDARARGEALRAWKRLRRELWGMWVRRRRMKDEG